MKIGILTHRGNWNYGGLFQALALHHWIREKGYDVEMINLNKVSLKVKKEYKLKLLICSPLFLFKMIFHKYKMKVHKQRDVNLSLLDKFIIFKKENDLNYSEEVTERELSKIIMKYDKIIVGSDQVWVYKLSRPLFFFMDWNSHFSGVKISYAACTPDLFIPRYNKQIIKKKLLEFDFLSVRDETTQEMVRRSCGLTPDIVVDPTLLYNFDYLLDNNIPSMPYVFTYCLGSEIKGGHEKVIQEVKKYYGDIKIIAVTIPHISLEAEKFADEILYDASPNQWLTLLANAAFVYTDSFHGCLFALKYEKPFLAYYSQPERASRLLDLKKQYGLSNVIVSSVQDMHLNRSIELGVDYKKVLPILENHKQKSISFLESVLCFNKNNKFD